MCHLHGAATIIRADEIPERDSLHHYQFGLDTLDTLDDSNVKYMPSPWWMLYWPDNGPLGFKQQYKEKLKAQPWPEVPPVDVSVKFRAGKLALSVLPWGIIQCTTSHTTPDLVSLEPFPPCSWSTVSRPRLGHSSNWIGSKSCDTTCYRCTMLLRSTRRRLACVSVACLVYIRTRFS